MFCRLVVFIPIWLFLMPPVLACIVGLVYQITQFFRNNRKLIYYGASIGWLAIGAVSLSLILLSLLLAIAKVSGFLINVTWLRAFAPIWIGLLVYAVCMLFVVAGGTLRSKKCHNFSSKMPFSVKKYCWCSSYDIIPSLAQAGIATFVVIFLGLLAQNLDNQAGVPWVQIFIPLYLVGIVFLGYALGVFFWVDWNEFEKWLRSK